MAVNGGLALELHFDDDGLSLALKRGCGTRVEGQAELADRLV